MQKKREVERKKQQRSSNIIHLIATQKKKVENCKNTQTKKLSRNTHESISIQDEREREKKEATKSN